MQGVAAPGVQFLEVSDTFGARRLAYRGQSGNGPTGVWLGGFRSDMLSTKAQALDDAAARAGRAFLRFDYSAHGESSGDFETATISQWRADAAHMIEQRTSGPLVLVGSSMGGWIALHLAQALPPERIAGLVLIAPAVDFTEALMWEQFSEEIREEIRQTGRWLRPSAYSPEPYPITRALIEDGRKNLLFGAPLALEARVHILQGRLDPDVPWRHALKLIEHLPRAEVSLSLIADGDHRLSREEDIARLVAAVDDLSLSAG